LGLVTLIALACLATLVGLLCLVAITALGLRPRRRLALLALTRLIAIALVTLLSLTLLALTGRLIAIALVTLLGLALLALSGRLIPITLVLLSLALFPPFLAVRLARLAAPLIRLAALLPRSILRSALALLTLTLLALIRCSLATCLISLSLALGLGLGPLMFLRPWLSFLVCLAGLVPLRLPMLLRGGGALRVVVLSAGVVNRATKLLPFELNSHAWSALSRLFPELVDAQTWRLWTLLWIMTKLALFADQSFEPLAPDNGCLAKV
jgi:hypothetical protein